MFAIARKEWVQLWPLIAVLLLITVVAQGGQWLIHPPDMADRGSRAWVFGRGQGVGWAFFIVGIITAHILMPSEREQRTLEFLKILPIRRRTLFAIKYGVGVGVVVFLELIDVAGDWIQASLNPDSFARSQLQAGSMAIEIAFPILANFIFVAYGLFLAYFGRLSWLFVLLYAFAVGVGESIHPALAILGVDALFQIEYFGMDAILPWRAWALHGLGAVVAFALASRLWMRGRAEARFVVGGDGVGAQPRLGRVLVWGGVGAAMLVSALLITVGDGSDADSSADTSADAPLRTLATSRFHFTYRPQDEANAMAVARQADRAYGRVRNWLGAPEVAGIVADLTDTSSEHSGVAGRQRLRMDVGGEQSPEYLAHVLYHEVTHVLVDALAGDSGDRRLAGLRFFSEGLAEYVAFELVGHDSRRQHGRAVASRANRQLQVGLTQLLSPVEFLRRHDEYLFYAFGEIWVAALVDVCGGPAPADLIRAAAEADVPQQLSGSALLRELVQRAGCSQDQVQNNFEQRLATASKAAEAIPYASAMPIDASTETTDGTGGRIRLKVVVHADAPGPWKVAFHLRDSPETKLSNYRVATRSLRAGVPVEVAVPVPPLSGQRFQFRVGVHPDGGGYPFFSRWRYTSASN